MRYLFLFLAILYPAVAAAFGGWRGREMGNDPFDWLMLVPLPTVAAAMFFFDWRRGYEWPALKMQLTLDALVICGVALVAFTFAWTTAFTTGTWFESPFPRAAAGLGIYLYSILAGLVLFRFLFGKSDGGKGRGAEAA